MNPGLGRNFEAMDLLEWLARLSVCGKSAGMLRPGGKLYLRDVAFSFRPAEYERAISAWIEHMPRVTGFSREEFETQLREEHSTFKWVLDGMLERAGFGDPGVAAPRPRRRGVAVPSPRC